MKLTPVGNTSLETFATTMPGLLYKSVRCKQAETFHQYLQK